LVGCIFALTTPWIIRAPRLPALLPPHRAIAAPRTYVYATCTPRCSTVCCLFVWFVFVGLFVVVVCCYIYIVAALLIPLPIYGFRLRYDPTHATCTPQLCVCLTPTAHTTPQRSLVFVTTHTLAPHTLPLLCQLFVRCARLRWRLVNTLQRSRLVCSSGFHAAGSTFYVCATLPRRLPPHYVTHTPLRRVYAFIYLAVAVTPPPPPPLPRLPSLVVGSVSVRVTLDCPDI